MFILMFAAGAVLAFLGFWLGVLGQECSINVTPWEIVLLVCAALVVLVGIIDGVRDLIGLIRRRQLRRRLRGRCGDDISDILPQRKGAAAGKHTVPPKPAPRTVPKSKKK